MTTEQAKLFDPEKVTFVNGVVIFNYKLLHPKMLGIIEYILKMEDLNNLQAIFVNTTGPNDKLGEYHPHQRSFALSLPYILEDSIKACKEKKLGLSISTTVWLNMIYVILHEIHHNIAYAVDFELTHSNQKVEEEEANDWAEETIDKVVMECDCECPPINELPWLGERIIAHLTEEIKNGDENEAKLQKNLMERGVIVSQSGREFTSMREYFKASAPIDKEETKAVEAEAEAEAVELKIEQSTVPESVVEASPANVFDQPKLPGDEMFTNSNTNSFPPQEAIDVEFSEVKETQTGRMTPEEIEMIESTAYCSEADTEYHTETNTPEVKVEQGWGYQVVDIKQQPTSQQTPKLEPKDNKSNPFGTNFATPQQPTQAPSTPREVAINLYRKLAGHMKKCGFNNGVYENPQVIVTEGLIADANELGILVSSRTYDSNGQYIWENVHTTGRIRGLLFKNGTLPAYDLLFKLGNTTKKVVRLIAQNSNKNSEPAARARAGAHIIWVIDADANTYMAKIENGVYEKL